MGPIRCTFVGGLALLSCACTSTAEELDSSPIWSPALDPHATGRSRFAGPQTGAVVTTIPLEGVVDGPVIASDGTIYVGVASRKPGTSEAVGATLVALNRDGSTKWTLPIANSTASNGVSLGPDNTVYYGSGSPNSVELTAVDPTGHVIWQNAAPWVQRITTDYIYAAGGNLATVLSIGDGSVLSTSPFTQVVLTGGGTVIAQGLEVEDLTSAGLAWSWNFGAVPSELVFSSERVADDDTLYVSLGTDTVDTPAPDVTYRVKQSGSSATVDAGDIAQGTFIGIGTDGTLYTSLANRIVASTFDGGVSWRSDQVGHVEGGTIDASGNVYVLAEDLTEASGVPEYLIGISSSGAELWRVRVPTSLPLGPSLWPPAIGDDGAIYIVCPNAICVVRD